MRLYFAACLLFFLAARTQGLADADQPTQGIASLTPVEIQSLKGLHGRKSDAAKALDSIIARAGKALHKKPVALVRVVTSGSGVSSGDQSNSKEAGRQADDSYMLAMAYAATGSAAYFEQARHILLSWAEVNQPGGDSVSGMKLVPMFRAYDLIRPWLPSSDRERIDRWLAGIAEAVISDQEEARKKNSPRGINNHRSHALLILAVIGCATGKQEFIHYAAGHFKDHIGVNLASFQGEPAGAGVDYHQRKAYHYVAYNLQSLGQLAIMLDRLGHLPGNPYAINYHPYNIEVNGASLLKALRVLLPFAAGEERHTTEFHGTDNKNDLKRVGNGSLRRIFDRKDAIPALEAANYFFSAVPDPSSGDRYDLVQIVMDISHRPSTALLLNRMISPIYNSGSVRPYWSSSRTISSSPR